MTKVYLIGENLLTIESLKKILIKRGFDTYSGDIFEAFKKDKISKVIPDILFWDSDIIESGKSVVFSCLDELDLPCKSIFVLSRSTISVLGFGLVHGIEGFVHKSGGIEDLNECLISLSKGRSYISPLLAGGFTSNIDKKIRNENSKLSILTSQERKILEFVKSRKTSKEIARALKISYKTVQNHRYNICRKLGLRGRNKLVEFANLYLS